MVMGNLEFSLLRFTHPFKVNEAARVADVAVLLIESIIHTGFLF
jgi:hypothetical protein